MVLITRLVVSAPLFIVALARPLPDNASVTGTVTFTRAGPPKSSQYNGYKSSDGNKLYGLKDSNPHKGAPTATVKAAPYSASGYKPDEGKPKGSDSYTTAKAYSYDDHSPGNKQKGVSKSKNSGSYGTTATSTAKAMKQTDPSEDYQMGDKKKGKWKVKMSGYDKPSAWNQGYNDCFQQCQAKYNFPYAKKQPTATASGPASGATHTVIVAPTQGVLRYLPFAVKASLGDTVKFKWGANNHTVTKGSAFLPCNKTSDNLFSSGTQNKDFEFDLHINDTQPIYLFCGTPTHCQKGMFAMINPASNPNAPTSVGSMMPSVVANYSSISKYASYSASVTKNKELAAQWGSDVDMASLPGWSHQFVAENILYTRSFLGTNPETLKDDGSIDLSSMETTPLELPKDIQAVLASSDNSTSTVTPTSSDSTYSTPAAADAASSTPATSNTPPSIGSLKSGGITITLPSSTILVIVVAFSSLLLQ